MARRTGAYEMSRLHLQAASSDRRELVLQALQSPAFYIYYQKKYSIFDVRIEQHGQHEFISGELVKYDPSQDVELVDEDAHQIDYRIIEDKVEYRIDFFLHLGSMVIAHRVLPHRFSAHAFRQVFANLLMVPHDRFFVHASLDQISEEFDIFQALAGFDTISRVTIELRPTNPSFRFTYRDVHEDIQELNAGCVRHEYISREGDGRGLDRESLSRHNVGGAFQMAMDGYGRASITGQEQGRERVITTRGSVVSARLELGERSGVLQQLYRLFQEVWERTADHSEPLA